MFLKLHKERVLKLLNLNACNPTTHKFNKRKTLCENEMDKNFYEFCVYQDQLIRFHYAGKLHTALALSSRTLLKFRKSRELEIAKLQVSIHCR